MYHFSVLPNTAKVVSVEPIQVSLISDNALSSPRISFSTEFPVETNFNSISTSNCENERDQEKERDMMESLSSSQAVTTQCLNVNC